MGNMEFISINSGISLKDAQLLDPILILITWNMEDRFPERDMLEI